MSNYEEMSLATMDGGALDEMFQDQLKLVARDVDDVNKPAEAERSITITIKVKPDEMRNEAKFHWSFKTKLADPDGRSVKVAMEVRNGKAYVAEYRPPLFSEIEQAEKESLPGKVTLIDQNKERNQS